MLFSGAWGDLLIWITKYMHKKVPVELEGQKRTNKEKGKPFCSNLFRVIHKLSHMNCFSLLKNLFVSFPFGDMVMSMKVYFLLCFHNSYSKYKEFFNSYFFYQGQNYVINLSFFFIQLLFPFVLHFVLKCSVIFSL